MNCYQQHLTRAQDLGSWTPNKAKVVKNRCTIRVDGRYAE